MAAIRKTYKVAFCFWSMAENTSAMPAGFGGLMRYKEEYDSKFKFGPGAVIAMIIVVIAIVAGLNIFYG